MFTQTKSKYNLPSEFSLKIFRLIILLVMFLNITIRSGI